MTNQHPDSTAPAGQMLIYQTEDGRLRVEARLENETLWLTQQQMAALFQTSRTNVVEHIQHIYDEGELEEEATCREFRQVRMEGTREVARSMALYNLDMILSVGYRVKSAVATRFRIWATQRLREYIVKGFVLDDERLKNPDGRPDYFDEMLARIRDIRASEKRFYQKVRDLFALASDYDKTDEATQQFFAIVQNLLLYAVTQQTAAEIILARANPADAYFGLLSWKGDQVRKQDILIAKNYLSEDEIDTLNRLVVIFLETAELRAKRQTVTTMDFWRENMGQIITANGFPLLTGAGSVSHARMERQISPLFLDYDQRRKTLEAEAADREDEAELKALENKIKHRTDPAS